MRYWVKVKESLGNTREDFLSVFSTLYSVVSTSASGVTMKAPLGQT